MQAELVERAERQQHKSTELSLKAGEHLAQPLAPLPTLAAQPLGGPDSANRQ